MGNMLNAASRATSYRQLTAMGGNHKLSGSVVRRRPPRRLVPTIPSVVDGAAMLWQYQLVRDVQRFGPRTESVLLFPVTHVGGATSFSDAL